MKGLVVRFFLLFLSSTVLLDCNSNTEPLMLELPLVADGSGMTSFVTDEGYSIELSGFRIAIQDIELTTAGETHATLFDRIKQLMGEGHCKTG